MRLPVVAATVSMMWAAVLWSSPAPAQLQLINFQQFVEGHKLTSADFGPGVTLTVVNDNPSHPNVAIIFDSACPGGCSGGDGDLITPGYHPSNTTAQGKVAIIAENINDANGNGIVDNPDDELAGGVIRLTFDRPRKLISVRVVDIEAFSGQGSFARWTLVGGGTATATFAGLGDNSAQTVNVSNPGPATALEFDFYTSGSIDDIVLKVACGDEILDAGEECDPPASQGGNPQCSDLCTLEQTLCGNGTVEAGEDCDPPASQGGAANCNDDCSTSDCGDGDIGAGEQCDPPASQGGDANCTDSCTVDDGGCGDGQVDPGEDCDPPAYLGGNATCNDDCSTSVCGDDETGAGEECDPPASQGGDADCTVTCERAECGNGIIDPGEECDPPASQGGEPTCDDFCVTATCGDGIVEGGEECDPPANQGGDANCYPDCTVGDPCGTGVLEEGDPCDIVGGSEICNNMEDDDDDNAIDCADDECLPDEITPEGGPLFCSGVCTLSPCLPILRDPAIIQFPKFPGGMSFFSMHGRVSADFGSFDPRLIPFTVIVANVQGKFLQETLPAGSLTHADRAGKRLRYKNEAARSAGGVYKASMRFRDVFGFPSYTIKLRIYGDFTGAMPPSVDAVTAYSDIAILWYGVGDEGEVGYNRSLWSRTRRGWILRLANYLE